MKDSPRMATGIDHVVIAVSDLDQTQADFTAAGFTVVPGGEHTNGETHNMLVAFADGSYFELIAWKNPVTPTPWLARLQDGEGLIDFALRSDDLHAEVDRLRAEGLNAPDPTPGGRTRPDGQRVDWENLRFDPETSPWLPFYCHSTNDRGLRVPSGEAAVHPNGVTGIASITIGVRDIAAAEREFMIVSDGKGGDGLQVGPTRIVLVAPIAEGDALSTAIANRGQVPIALELTTNNPSRAGLLDIDLTHGAAITLVS